MEKKLVTRYRFRKIGPHVHVRLFMGFAPSELGANATLGLCGGLVMAAEEWTAFVSTVASNDYAVVQFIDETAVVGLDNP